MHVGAAMEGWLHKAAIFASGSYAQLSNLAYAIEARSKRRNKEDDLDHSAYTFAIHPFICTSSNVSATS